MKNKIFYLPLMFLALFSAAGFASSAVYRLGPYNLNQDLAPWQADDSAAVNHELRLSLPENDASIRIMPEFLLAHEIKDDVQKMLEESHGIWQEGFQFSNPSLKILERKLLALKENQIALSVVSVYEKNKERRHLKRLYQWIPSHAMILISEVTAEETAWDEVLGRFSRMMDMVEVDKGYEVSPCVKTFFRARRFNQIKDEQIRSQAFLDFQGTVALYEQDLLREIELHPHHQWTHYFMLSYLKAFNPEGIYLGEGADLTQAGAYLNQAKEVSPNPEALNSLGLENLPILFKAANEKF